MSVKKSYVVQCLRPGLKPGYLRCVWRSEDCSQTQWAVVQNIKDATQVEEGGVDFLAISELYKEVGERHLLILANSDDVKQVNPDTPQKLKLGPIREGDINAAVSFQVTCYVCMAPLFISGVERLDDVVRKAGGIGWHSVETGNDTVSTACPDCIKEMQEEGLQS